MKSLKAFEKKINEKEIDFEEKIQESEILSKLMILSENESLREINLKSISSISQIKSYNEKLSKDPKFYKFITNYLKSLLENNNTTVII